MSELPFDRTLQKVGNLQKDLLDMSVQVPEVVGISSTTLNIKTTTRVIKYLNDKKIFFGRKENRFKETTILSILVNSQIEEYSCYPAGNIMCSMGAFSYSESPLDRVAQIGRYCSIAAGLQIFRARHPIEWVTTSSITYDYSNASGYRNFVAAHRDFIEGAFKRISPPAGGAGIIIENDVWIGQNVQISRGVTLKTGSVIAAGSVVTKNVEPYTIVGGVPARVIRLRFPEKLIEKLLRLRWWEFGPDIFQKLDYRNPERFVEEISEIPDTNRFNAKLLNIPQMLRDLQIEGQ